MKEFLKILILFLSFIIFLNNTSYSETNKISNINYELKIKENDDIDVIEILEGNFLIGTEFFQLYENLNLNNITNFCVFENGKKYDYLDSFESYLLREEKKQKSSLKETLDGIELCFGIGNNGYHKFKLNYTLKNVFKNNELDLDILNCTYNNIENVNIKINGNFTSNVIAKLKNCNGNISIKNNQILYKINDVNKKITIYLNYDGIDNSIKKDKIITIKSKDKTNVIIILKVIIIFLLLFSVIVGIYIYILNKRRIMFKFNPF